MRGAADEFSAFAAAIRCSGKRVADPAGIEGPAGAVEGLGLLDVETVLTGEKTLREVEGNPRHERRAVSRLRNACRTDGAGPTAPVRSCASTTGGSTARPLRAASSPAPMCMASSPTTASAASWLGSLGARSEIAYEATIEQTLDKLAEHCAAHLDLDALLDAAR